MRSVHKLTRISLLVVMFTVIDQVVQGNTSLSITETVLGRKTQSVVSVVIIIKDT